MKKAKTDENLKDPDEFAVLVMHKIKHQILDGLDYRMKTIEDTNDRFKAEKLEELQKARKWVKGILWERGAWKEFYKEKK